ncbi:MAG: TSUP family transporter, partial [Solirubrobacterales bacterium]
PVSLVGAWRQHRYGNLDHRAGLVIGAAAIPFAVIGVVVVNSVPGRAVEIAFALLLLYVAWQMGRGGLAELREGREPAGKPPGTS